MRNDLQLRTICSLLSKKYYTAIPLFRKGAFYPPMVGTSTEFDTVLELCQDQHRRIVLAVLATEKRSLTVNDLTTAIIKQNHHAHPVEVSKGEIRQIRTALFHIHLPKLEDLSLVDYDRERHLVEPTSQFDQLQPQLSALIDADPDLEAPVALNPDSSLNDVDS